MTNATSGQMSNLAVALPRSVHRKQRCPQRFLPKFLLERRPDDDVHDDHLVLDGHEHHAFRGHGALTHGYRPSAREPTG
jgi:hypothetical protein